MASLDVGRSYLILTSFKYPVNTGHLQYRKNNSEEPADELSKLGRVFDRQPGDQVCLIKQYLRHFFGFGPVLFQRPFFKAQSAVAAV